jgi:hypothetical protein
VYQLHLGEKSARCCDGISRRGLLEIGGLGLFGLGLPHLLQAEETIAEATTRARAKSVVLVYLGGGMSHHDTFDMKPEAVEETRGKYQPMATNVVGTKICELLPKMARTMDKVTLVRSQSHDDIRHEAATNYVMSGWFDNGFGEHPAMGAVVSHELGAGAKLPPYVAVPRNPSFSWELGKSAFLGSRYESFKAGDPNQENYRVRDLAMSDGINLARAERRQSLLSVVDGLARRVEGNDQVDSYDRFQKKAGAMVLSSHARDAFAIEKENAEMRERYGRNTFGQSCLLARRLIESGVRFVTVNSGGWDHHSQIWNNLERMLPMFDRGFSTLIHDMDERGLLADTLVVCLGEFGRAPIVDAMIGRNHWSKAGSMLFAGAGVARGRVIGKTDAEGAETIDNPVRPTDVCSTVYQALGISPRALLHTPDNRPVAILDEGRNLNELFG